MQRRCCCRCIYLGYTTQVSLLRALSQLNQRCLLQLSSSEDRRTNRQSACWCPYAEQHDAQRYLAAASGPSDRAFPVADSNECRCQRRGPLT